MLKAAGRAFTAFGYNTVYNILIYSNAVLLNCAAESRYLPPPYTAPNLDQSAYTLKKKFSVGPCAKMGSHTFMLNADMLYFITVKCSNILSSFS